MIFSANITTSKDTAKDDLKRTVLQVTKGLVYKVEFYFPSGSAGLAGVAVFDGLYQCWPSTVGEFFIGESQTISFDDLYLKEAAPYTFQILTYNLDDTHSHAIGVRIGLVSKDAFLARFMPTKGAEFMADLVKKLNVEQAVLQGTQKITVATTPAKFLESVKQVKSVVVPAEPVTPAIKIFTPQQVERFGIVPTGGEVPSR